MDMKLNFSWNKNKKNNERVVGDTNVLTKKKRIAESENTVDFIRSIEHNTITSSNPEKKEEEIVIPLVQSKYQPLKIKAKTKVDNGDVEVKDELKKEAMERIIAEAKDANENGQQGALVIPMTDSGAAQEEVEEEIPDADYEAIPVMQFGLAALRGMGSKQEIDARLPLAPPQPVRRSKGLGLGAVLEKDVRPKGEDGEGAEELTMKRGTRCCVVKGRLSGRYGTIDAVDGNTDRVIVAMSSAAGGGTVTMPSVTVRLVTEKEFKKYSKYLNRETAEAYKAKEEARMEKEREKDRLWRERESEKAERARRKEREKEAARRREDEQRQRALKRPREEKEKTRRAWVRPRLRVRLVEKNYCGGRFYKEKLVVMDMPSPTVCVCQTDSGRILDDIGVSMLETVIPRGDRATVMILHGEYKSELAEIVEKDPTRCKAIVQLNSEKLLLTYDYDDLCEFVG